MLDERKAAVLRAVVEEYIQTGLPVGSALVAQRAGLTVSSATVRNEMGQLERDGYLVQPHTSAGRIPTDAGYRFFVDALAPTGTLEPAQSQQVRTFFARAHGELERMLADTSQLLSGLTDYAAVVVAPKVEATLTVRSVQLVGLGARVVMAVVVLSNGAIEKRTLDLDAEASDAVVAAASVHLGGALTGTVWGTAPTDASPVAATVDALVLRATAAIGARVAEASDQVYIGGAARMAAAFDAVGTIRQVLTILEQQYVMVGLISDVLDRGLSVAIGTEHGLQPLADCSVVVAPYEIEGERGGTVAILGPTRMHYEHALAAVAVVSRRLGRALSEGA
jgi:heat-inducible transcriptional repressor